jgi:hypothetical protein
MNLKTQNKIIEFLKLKGESQSKEEIRNYLNLPEQEIRSAVHALLDQHKISPDLFWKLKLNV